MRDLAEIQRWFHAAITGEAPHEAGELIAGPRPDIQLAIYHRMYRARLIDTLRGEFPKLAQLVGSTWDELVIRYLRACPPEHPDIREAGRRLPEFLRAAGRWWEADLAGLEWARSDVFFGADTTPLTRQDLATLAPERFAELVLSLVPAHALLELESNADDVWSALEDQLPPPAPAPASRTVVVWRRNATTVVHRRVDADEAGCFATLARGAPYSDVCAALETAPDPVSRAIELLLRWLDAALLDAAAMNPYGSESER